MANLSSLFLNPFKTLPNYLSKPPLSLLPPSFSNSFSPSPPSSSSSFIISFSGSKLLSPSRRTASPFYCNCVHTGFPNTTQYEFYDGSPEVELRVQLGDTNVQDAKDVYVDANECSLVVGVKSSGSLRVLMETNQLYDRIKPGETMWYLDDDQLVISLKKHDTELKWPDIVESWESLTVGVMLLLKGTTIYLVRDSTEINEKVARELAVGLGYTPLDTKGLLEAYTKQSIDSYEDTAKEEARRQVSDGSEAYSKADVVVKLGGWDSDHAKAVAQASLSALKQLILSDKKLPGKKNLYIRLGCRGDWPDIKPPGWDPSSETEEPTAQL